MSLFIKILANFIYTGLLWFKGRRIIKDKYYTTFRINCMIHTLSAFYAYIIREVNYFDPALPEVPAIVLLLSIDFRVPAGSAAPLIL